MPRDLWMKRSKPCSWENSRDRCSAGGKQRAGGWFPLRSRQDWAPLSPSPGAEGAFTASAGAAVGHQRNRSSRRELPTSPRSRAQALRDNLRRGQVGREGLVPRHFYHGKWLFGGRGRPSRGTNPPCHASRPQAPR